MRKCVKLRIELTFLFRAPHSARCTSFVQSLCERCLQGLQEELNAGKHIEKIVLFEVLS